MPLAVQRLGIHRPAHLASPSSLRAASASAAAYSPAGVLLGHAYLLIHALLTLERERAAAAAGSEVGGRRRAVVLSTVLAGTVALPIGLFGRLLGLSTLPPLASLSPSLFPSSASSSAGVGAGAGHGHLAAYVLLALATLILEPLVRAALEPHCSTRAQVAHGWPLAVLGVIIIGYIGFGLRTGIAEVVVALCVGLGELVDICAQRAGTTLIYPVDRTLQVYVQS